MLSIIANISHFTAIIFHDHSTTFQVTTFVILTTLQIYQDPQSISSSCFLFLSYPLYISWSTIITSLIYCQNHSILLQSCTPLPNYNIAKINHLSTLRLHYGAWKSLKKNTKYRWLLSLPIEGYDLRGPAAQHRRHNLFLELRLVPFSKKTNSSFLFSHQPFNSFSLILTPRWWSFFLF